MKVASGFSLRRGYANDSAENRYISVKLKFAPAQTEEINDDDLVIMLNWLAV